MIRRTTPSKQLFSSTPTNYNCCGSFTMDTGRHHEATFVEKETPKTTKGIDQHLNSQNRSYATATTDQANHSSRGKKPQVKPLSFIYSLKEQAKLDHHQSSQEATRSVSKDRSRKDQRMKVTVREGEEQSVYKGIEKLNVELGQRIKANNLLPSELLSPVKDQSVKAETFQQKNSFLQQIKSLRQRYDQLLQEEATLKSHKMNKRHFYSNHVSDLRIRQRDIELLCAQSGAEVESLKQQLQRLGV